LSVLLYLGRRHLTKVFSKGDCEWKGKAGKREEGSEKLRGQNTKTKKKKNPNTQTNPHHKKKKKKRTLVIKEKNTEWHNISPVARSPEVIFCRLGEASKEMQRLSQEKEPGIERKKSNFLERNCSTILRDRRKQGGSIPRRGEGGGEEKRKKRIPNDQSP